MDDRMSDLPDSILHEILSYLETREAAKTALLSKRWGNLWVYTPALDFCNITENRVRRAILDHKALNIRRLRISTRWYDDKDEGVDAVRLIEELCNRAERFSPCKLTRGFVSIGGSLRILEISGCEIMGSDRMKLTCVETLSVHCSYGQSNEALNNLISSCPNVKNLDLDLRNGSVTRIDLCLPQLKKMVISSCTFLRKLTVDAPNLQHAELSSPGKGLIFSMGNSFDLIYARLQVEFRMQNYMVFRDLICEFAMAKVLVVKFDRYRLPGDLFEMSTPRRNVKDLFEKSTPRCCNVKKLEVNGDVSFALSILKLFPGLEDFTFLCSRDASRSSVVEVGKFMDLRDVKIYCLKNSLKRITVTGFRGRDIEAKFMKFLAENAKVLEAMYLDKWFGSVPGLLKVGSDLMTSRASPHAQIIFT